LVPFWKLITIKGQREKGDTESQCKLKDRFTFVVATFACRLEKGKKKRGLGPGAIPLCGIAKVGQSPRAFCLRSRPLKRKSEVKDTEYFIEN